jgi:hypothetical protein
MRRLLLLLLLSLSVHADEQLVVVVSQKSPLQQLSREDISALYLGNLAANSLAQTLRVLDLDDSKARDDFYTHLVGRSRNQMRAYWSRMVFTGKGKPPRALNVIAIIEELQSDPNLIAYLPSNQLPANLRPLLHLP